MVVSVDRGNLKDVHEPVYSDIAAKWTGDYCFRMISERKSLPSMVELQVRERMAWGPPRVTFDSRGPLHRMADAMATLVLRRAQGAEWADQLIVHLLQTYRYQGEDLAANVLRIHDETEYLRSFMRNENDRLARAR